MEFILVLIEIGFILIPLMIIIETMKSKFEDIYNPIKKNNKEFLSDYGFIEVENIKTRNIL